MRISDWSSDVVSSDLGEGPFVNGLAEEHERRLVAHADVDADLLPLALQHRLHQRAHEIGRASCRDRVCPYVKITGDAVPKKKKKKIQAETLKIHNKTKNENEL